MSTTSARIDIPGAGMIRAGGPDAVIACAHTHIRHAVVRPLIDAGMPL